MHLSELAKLTLEWLETVEHGSDELFQATQDRLIEYLLSTGNSHDQVQHWMDYSVEMQAYEDETIESVMETEVAIARAMGRIR
jgi:hypothetical protein